ncbi:ubiquitin-like protein Pup [Luteococcus peritonei]|uniref:Prokaryotic ubiquitin-like protein Pup n=1 Tax=Luteococcus peritonei TaxID=88874 RepID=A0ABW4RU73_9ACTN
MSEQHRVQRPQRRQEETTEQVEQAAQHDDAGFDALLDEIDGLLETNAAEYVRSFVQKGGQ